MKRHKNARKEKARETKPYPPTQTTKKTGACYVRKEICGQWSTDAHTLEGFRAVAHCCGMTTVVRQAKQEHFSVLFPPPILSLCSRPRMLDTNGTASGTAPESEGLARPPRPFWAAVPPLLCLYLEDMVTLACAAATASTDDSELLELQESGVMMLTEVVRMFAQVSWLIGIFVVCCFCCVLFVCRCVFCVVR